MSWRREWDSNSCASFGFYKLEIPRCQGCRKCQQCRRTLHRIAPRAIGDGNRDGTGAASVECQARRLVRPRIARGLRRDLYLLSAESALPSASKRSTTIAPKWHALRAHLFREMVRRKRGFAASSSRVRWISAMRLARSVSSNVEGHKLWCSSCFDMRARASSRATGAASRQNGPNRTTICARRRRRHSSNVAV